MKKHLNPLQFLAMLSIFLLPGNVLTKDIYEVRVLAKNIPEWSKSAVNNIKGKTQVPILVPTIKIVNYTVVIAKSEADAISYSIYYGGENVPCIISTCGLFGRAGGELITVNTIDYSKEYQNLVLAPYVKKGGYITLSKNVRGFYLPAFCFLYCNGGSIVWRQGKYQYFVSYRRGGSLQELVKFANSAIENQP
jgi:hypothetical protein